MLQIEKVIVYTNKTKKKTTGKKPFTRIVSFSIDAWCVQYLFFRALLESRQIYVCWMVGCSCNWIDGNHLKFLDCLCYLLFFFLLLFISFFLISKHSILFGHSWIGFQGKMRYKKCVKLKFKTKQFDNRKSFSFLFLSLHSEKINFNCYLFSSWKCFSAIFIILSIHR